MQNRNTINLCWEKEFTPLEWKVDMAEVALRTYVDEIDSQIDNGQIDEAIAHTRHILQKYPKYVDAYRLLGKALIEKSRHQDAADIFQRVLSVEPDDFVSHVGMSIVREDDGSLGASIWHMERAYEVQPANNAIQGELKRLYGKRDGLEPPRIRLTRGALARMYMKGQLHPQSVAELRAALSSDADRQDLKALLAEALWQDQQRVEAAEVSNDILEDLPYCRSANRILSAAWSEGGRDGEAKIYRERLQALDPYEAVRQNGDGVNNGQNIPVDAVSLRRLEYRPGIDEFADDERPDWMQALGAEFEDPSESDGEETPDWLRESAEVEVAGTGIADAASQSTPTDDVPDWLAEVGMEEDEISGAAAETESTLGAETTDNLHEAAEPGETLDWLAETIEAPGDESSDDLPGWLAEAGAENIEPESETAEDIPDWLVGSPSDSESTEDHPTEEGETITAEDIPDFMRDAGWSERDPNIELDDLPPIPDDMPITPPPAGESPDWLRTAMDTGESEIDDDDAIEPGDMPSWLATQRPPEMEAVVESGSSIAEEEVEVEPPEWLRNSLGEEEPEPDEEDTPVAATVPDWLKESDGSPDDTVVGWLKDTQPSEVVDQPEWLRSPAVLAAETQPGELTEEEVPDWLQGTVTPAEREDDDKDIDWLTKVEEETGNQPAVHFGPSDADPFADMQAAAPGLPDTDKLGETFGDGEDEEIWVAPDAPADEEGPTPESSWLSEAASDEPDASEPESDEAEQDAAHEWLESLAAKQGAPEEELITSSEERVEEVPEWISGYEEETSTAELTKEILDWSLDAELKVEEPESIAPDTSIDDPLDEVQVDIVEEASPELEAQPDLTGEFGEEGDDTSAATPDLADEDAALAWLEGLAAKQGASEEELISEPDTRTDELPSWVSDMSETAVDEEQEPSVESDSADSELLSTDELDELDEQQAEDWIAKLPQAHSEGGVEIDPEMAMDVPETTATEEARIVTTDLPEWLREPVDEMDSTTEASTLPAWLAENDEETSTGELSAEGEMPESSVTEDEAELQEDILAATIANESIAATVEDAVTIEAFPSAEGLDIGEEAEAIQQPEAAPEVEPMAELEAMTDGAPEAPASEEYEDLSEIAVEPEIVVDSTPEPATSIIPAKVEPEAAIEPEIVRESVPQPVSPVMAVNAEADLEPTEQLEDKWGMEALANARDYLSEDDWPRAMKQYGRLVKSDSMLATVITDLEQASRESIDVPAELLKTLGDAYVKDDNLRLALESYQKALKNI